MWFTEQDMVDFANLVDWDGRCTKEDVDFFINSTWFNKRESTPKQSVKIAILQPKFFVRSKTNNGDLGKQYFFVAIAEGHEEPVLSAHKLILSADHNLFADHTPLKAYKGKVLYEQVYGIKLSTLTQVLNVLINYKILGYGTNKDI